MSLDRQQSQEAFFGNMAGNAVDLAMLMGLSIERVRDVTPNDPKEYFDLIPTDFIGDEDESDAGESPELLRVNEFAESAIERLVGTRGYRVTLMRSKIEYLTDEQASRIYDPGRIKFNYSDAVFKKKLTVDFIDSVGALDSLSEFDPDTMTDIQRSDVYSGAQNLGRLLLIVAHKHADMLHLPDGSIETRQQAEAAGRILSFVDLADPELEREIRDEVVGRADDFPELDIQAWEQELFHDIFQTSER